MAETDQRRADGPADMLANRQLDYATKDTENRCNRVECLLVEFLMPYDIMVFEIVVLPIPEAMGIVVTLRSIEVILEKSWSKLNKIIS